MSLLETFLKARGYKSGNDAAHIAPFLPYFLADTLYLTFEEHIKGHLKQKEKQMGNLMMKNYHNFIHDFFHCFPREQQGQLVDMMDQFHEYISHDIDIFLVSVEQVVMQMPLHHRKIFSAICLIRVLSANVKYSWECIYRRSPSEPIPNNDKDGIAHYGNRLFLEYSRYTPRYLEKTDLAMFPGVKAAEKALVNRVLNFIESYTNEDSN